MEGDENRLDRRSRIKRIKYGRKHSRPNVDPTRQEGMKGMDLDENKDVLYRHLMVVEKVDARVKGTERRTATTGREPVSDSMSGPAGWLPWELEQAGRKAAELNIGAIHLPRREVVRHCPVRSSLTAPCEEGMYMCELGLAVAELGFYAGYSRQSSEDGQPRKSSGH